ncbi:MAG: beta-ketoacyl-ACP synthase III [Candidatus Limiplasma sp.]|nr:beta-ketoacyl-ACP synthase III [Candidatus Limiplasma sp.]MEA5144832.1 beta-ketoacyl-ACP synthase III [Candidatus Limiplasma sp.]
MRIISFGHALPKRSVTNQELTAFLDTTDEWIVEHTGIRSRRILSGKETVSGLGAKAAKMALTRAGLTAKDVDYILCSTTAGEMTFPATSCLIQEKLGATCPSMDLNAGCTGFLYALDMADALLSSGKAKRVLVLCAEQISRLSDWTDRSTCVLFGDAAGAALCEAGDGLKTIRLSAKGNATPLHAWPDGGNSPFLEDRQPAQPLYMNGQEIFKFAVSHSSRDIAAVMADADLTADQVDHFVLHQANLRIIEAARARLKQPTEKFPVNIHDHGNTSSACIPVLLSEMAEDGRLLRGQTLVLSAFGAGLTTGAAVLQY